MDLFKFLRWICEHKWRQIFNMVRFHNVALGTSVENWWDNDGNEIAFSRGNKAFIAFNNEDYVSARVRVTCRSTHIQILTFNSICDVTGDIHEFIIVIHCL